MYRWLAREIKLDGAQGESVVDKQEERRRETTRATTRGKVRAIGPGCVGPCTGGPDLVSTALDDAPVLRA
jgi:hypothetical protein